MSRLRVRTRVLLLAVLALASGVAGGAALFASGWGGPGMMAASILGLGALGLAIWIHRTIAAQLRRMTEILRTLAKGDLNTALPDVPDGNGTADEVTLLLRQFLDFVREVSPVMTNVRSASNALVAASAQVASASQGLSQGTTEQATSVAEITANLEQMNAIIGQNAANANQTREIGRASCRERVYDDV